MRENFEAYLLIAIAIVTLAVWAKASFDGVTDEFAITHDHFGKRGDGDFEAAQLFRLLFAGAALAGGIYGLIFGFE